MTLNTLKKPVRPYIGITGFMQSEEIRACLDIFPPEPYTHRLMAGVLASGATLRGESGWKPRRYPPVTDIASIFVDDPRVLNTLHFSTKKEALAWSLCEVTDLAGPLLDAIQLNMVWPDRLELDRFCSAYPRIQIILQVGAQALSLCCDMNGFFRADELARRVQLYTDDGLIHHILIDPSGGTGTPFDSPTVNQILSRFPQNHFKINLGVAGGLSSSTMNPLLNLNYPLMKLSWDAEGRLRDENDHLMLPEALAYLRASVGILETERGRVLPRLKRLYKEANEEKGEER